MGQLLECANVDTAAKLDRGLADVDKYGNSFA
jgi:hypothetical protein